jgi:anti-sigma factor RsiW
MPCCTEDQLQRYYDNELSEPQRAAVESHLSGCPSCTQTLAQLHQLSSLITSAPAARLSTDALDRIANSDRSHRERPVLRIAEWLTAAAAAVLVGGLLAWPSSRSDVATVEPFWQTMAVTPPAEAHEDANRDLLVAAQWMADDLSAGERRE